jgi:multiple sugar transport system ATP-binding protein
MDEPLSNLDAALRVQMRVELKRLHERLGVTTVYVTHDQVEAMTMGDRIAIMNHGRLQQIDTPERLFERPANLFVAGFIGSPKMNLLPGEVASAGGKPAVAWFDTAIPLVGPLGAAVENHYQARLVVGIRPEDLRWAQDAPSSCCVRLQGVVEVVEPLGSETYVVAQIGDEAFTARFPPRSGLVAGAHVELAFDPTHLHVFDAQTGQNILASSSELGLANGEETSKEPSSDVVHVGRSS